jgi:hypothetical protein
MTALFKLYRNHVIGTPKKAIIFDTVVFVGSLKPSVRIALNVSSSKVHCTSKVVKHIYDDRPPLHVEPILKNLSQVIKRPDFVYKNNKDRADRTGDYVFVKTIKKDEFLAIIQKEKDKNDVHYIVTAWILRDKHYLKDYELLWKF